MHFSVHVYLVGKLDHIAVFGIRLRYCAVWQIESEKLFGNIEEVYKASCQFWVKHMSQVVRRSRKTGEQLDCCLLKPGFLSVRLTLPITALLLLEIC